MRVCQLGTSFFVVYICNFVSTPVLRYWCPVKIRKRFPRQHISGQPIWLVYIWTILGVKLQDKA